MPETDAASLRQSCLAEPVDSGSTFECNYMREIKFRAWGGDQTKYFVYFSVPGETEDRMVVSDDVNSGSTGVACAHLCRIFIGIDREPQYLAIAKKRISEASANPNNSNMPTQPKLHISCGRLAISNHEVATPA